MKEEVNKILSHPELFTPENLPVFEKIVEEYPFFQPSYFLLLKHYKDISFLKYQELLERYVWYIFDKRLLFDFVNSEFSSIDSKEETFSRSDEPVVTKSTSPHTSNTPFTPRRDKDTLQETLSETLSQANQIELSDEFEKKILPDVEFELDDSIEILKPDITTEDFSILVSEIADKGSDIFLELDDSSTSVEKTSTSHADNDEIAVLKEEEEKINIPQTGNFARKATEQFAIIDEFLEKLPHIKPQPIENTTPVTDISANSVDEHDDFMTETFARILVKQGSYDKAIEIYRKLILKFPEKNTYFASQIEEIEKLRNNPKE
ncbi:MAG: hypothetical protein N2662_08645 [Bacteroidales bacterium]|nr:hypothetical protein [Bacteroidales bacterium]